MLRHVLGQACDKTALQAVLQLVLPRLSSTNGWGPASAHLQACLHHPEHGASMSARCSFSSQVTASRAEQVVPAALLQELRQLDSQLKQQSSVDGLKRLNLSKDSLPQPIPQHEVEPGLFTLQAHVRAVEGSNAVRWLRKAGRTPIRIQSLWPGNQGLLLHVHKPDAEKLVRLYGRQGCKARVIAVQVVHPDDPSSVLGVIRAKPQEVHMTSTRVFLEHIDLLYCPKDRIVKVDVPIKLVNDDIAPGVKAGGWMFIERRTVRYQALGDAIPPHIELDVKHLGLQEVVKVRDLPVPPGTRLPGPAYHHVVVRCTNEVGTA